MIKDILEKYIGQFLDEKQLPSGLSEKEDKMLEDLEYKKNKDKV